MQVTQDSRRNPGPSQRHRRADAGVEHPCRQGRNDPRLDLNVDETSAGALLAVVNPYATTVIRMPAVMNHNFLLDMGRMTA
jgi:hypothetical protein